MPDNRKRIKRIVIFAAGIWGISLLVFLFYVYSVREVRVWFFAGYGIWNFLVFSAAYIFISREVSHVMREVDDCIQSLIDGEPVLKFSMQEESLLGKFQMQIVKLYQMMKGARETEEKIRKEMSEIVSDLVHQVNTPLTNIQMYAGFLIQEDLPKEERAQISEVISSQVEKLGWFAEGFSKTARLEDDVMQIVPKVQPILDMVLSAVDQIALKASENGNEIVLLGRQDICAAYDRRWSEEALFNLLDNAVKYGIKNTPVTVEMSEYDMFVRIDVTNCGGVIPKEDYNKIFNRFYRGRNAALVKEGVGLGLYLTRKIITEQGGYVKVGNNGQKGNVFTIFLRRR